MTLSLSQESQETQAFPSGPLTLSLPLLRRNGGAVESGFRALCVLCELESIIFFPLNSRKLLTHTLKPRHQKHLQRLVLWPASF